MAERLARRLGTTDAVVIGLSAMIGAGVFVAFGPAVQAAGSWLFPALAIAAVVAYCNATSSARLAALYPESGGTYVYGRRRLSPFWGYLAGWGFTVGKTASCAAMALTFGAYVAPALAQPLAIGAVAGVTALNLLGVQRSAGAARVMIAFVLAVLAMVVAAGLMSWPAPPFSLADPTAHGMPDPLATPGWLGLSPEPEPEISMVALTVADEGSWSLLGVLQGAGLLFFAFAGYARIATLGEEVRDPSRTIPRAIGIALAVTLVVYTLVALAALHALGPERLGLSRAPLADVARTADVTWLVPVVSAGAAVAALGALLALVLGVSRTVLAMARNRDLPASLDAIHPVRQVPHRAELAVGVTVIILLLLADLRGAIAFSSFGVLVYYAIANAAALTLTRAEGAPHRAIPVAGLGLCLLLAFTLPWTAVVTGLAVFAFGAVLWFLRHRSTAGR
ncbi:APC family permease [Nonomuraea endophytica]|uniref:APA family basic amino acid/polyamine antiporter n=1 Tax=Nonomuraea endophytica TaxID=714136 RepID=A0A7W7ZZ82_9ACTN|nr:APC family permease [Nonomuraea endophytica]MBB5076545.1 APA family basic amino acid/polyamine antiporter [Nonomuraea endophytica]